MIKPQGFVNWIESVQLKKIYEKALKPFCLDKNFAILKKIPNHFHLLLWLRWVFSRNFSKGFYLVQDTEIIFLHDVSLFN